MNELFYRLDSLRIYPENFHERCVKEIEKYIEEKTTKLKADVEECWDILNGIKPPPNRIQ
jgi:hypothetical protein